MKAYGLKSIDSEKYFLENEKLLISSLTDLNWGLSGE